MATTGLEDETEGQETDIVPAVNHFIIENVFAVVENHLYFCFRVFLYLYIFYTATICYNLTIIDPLKLAKLVPKTKFLDINSFQVNNCKLIYKTLSFGNGTSPKAHPY